MGILSPNLTTEKQRSERLNTSPQVTELLSDTAGWYTLLFHSCLFLMISQAAHGGGAEGEQAVDGRVSHTLISPPPAPTHQVRGHTDSTEFTTTCLFQLQILFDLHYEIQVRFFFKEERKAIME